MSEQVASELVVDEPSATASRGPRVLLLCETLALTGGVERFVCQLGNELAELGMQVAVGSADEGDCPAAFPLRDGVRLLHGGAERGQRRTSGGPRAWRLLRRQWRVGRALGRLVEAEHADVVVLNGLVAACVTLALHPRVAARTICCDHNHFMARSRVWRTLRRWLYPKVAAVVSLTLADAPLFARLNPNTQAIVNASTLSAETPSDAPGLGVLAVGRHQAQKGFDLLLAAWADVIAACPEARLVIVGQGPLREELAALAVQLGVAASVTFRPPTDRIGTLYREAALFVLSSRYEGMPLSLLEAQAMGVPSVAFDCPTGPRDILGGDGQAGLLVPAEDSGELARAIVALLLDPARRARMGRAAIARSRAVFGRADQIEAWAALIRRVAGSHAASP